jgi:hypothetical protein
MLIICKKTFDILIITKWELWLLYIYVVTLSSFWNTLHDGVFTVFMLEEVKWLILSLFGVRDSIQDKVSIDSVCRSLSIRTMRILVFPQSRHLSDTWSSEHVGILWFQIESHDSTFSNLHCVIITEWLPKYRMQMKYTVKYHLRWSDNKVFYLSLYNPVMTHGPLWWGKVIRN